MATLMLLIKKITLLLLLLSSSFLSTSLAGGKSTFTKELAKEMDIASYKEISSKSPQTTNNMDAIIIHERLLKANTRDYGNYDPAPALVKPPFKLIPN